MNELNQNQPTRGSWVQTDRKAHEAWGKLIISKPSAAALLHCLVSQMGDKNAVVVSQGMLAKMMGKSIDTIKRAIKDLEARNWIEVVKIGKGRECAYIVNDRVAWQGKRENIRYSIFSANVIVDYEDQDLAMIDKATGELRQIPALYPNEFQIPFGDGEEPPSQPFLEDLEPDLPTRQTDALSEFERLEAQGQQRLID